MKKLSLIVSIFALFIISTSTFADDGTTASSNNSNATKENMKSGDSPVMVNVIASIEVKEGHLAEFTKIFTDNVPNVLAEEGCIEYLPTIDVSTDIGVQEVNKNVVTIIEKWESLDHLYAHLKAPHMNTYREKVKDIVVGVTIKVLTEASK